MGLGGRESLFSATVTVRTKCLFSLAETASYSLTLFPFLPEAHGQNTYHASIAVGLEDWILVNGVGPLPGLAMAPLIFHFSLVWPWHFSLSLSPHVLDVGVLAGLRSHTLKTVEAFSALAPVKWHGLKEHLSPATAGHSVRSSTRINFCCLQLRI